MICMGLDLSEEVGWAFGDKAERPHFGTFTLPGFSDAKRARTMASVYSAVMAMVRANNVEGVAIEAPGIGIRRKNKRGITTPTSAHGTQVLTMLSGAAQAGAINGGAKFLWMPQSNEWRKAVLGNGYPEHPKSAAVEYCNLFLKCAVTNHNAAEGLCLMVFAHGQARLL